MCAQSISPTVLVASDDLPLLEDIVRHLQDIPDWKLITSPGSSAEMLAASEANLPDVVVVSEVLARELARRAADMGAASLVVVGRQEHNATLKAALKIGARGFVLWPKEAKMLRGLVEKDAAIGSSRPAPEGRFFGVWSPKGGSGASIVAAHLAACLTRTSDRCYLADLDLDHADQTAILGVEGQTKTFADLLRMGDELSPSIVESVAWGHPGGFRAILSPGSMGEAALVKGKDLARVLGFVRQSADYLVGDLPSGLNEISMSLIEETTVTLLVVTPDLLCLKRARDALKVLRASGLSGSRFELVLNQTNSFGVPEKDVRAVLGLTAAAEVRADVQLYQCANRGILCPSGKKMLRGLARELAGDGALPSARRRRLRIGSAS